MVNSSVDCHTEKSVVGEFYCVINGVCVIKVGRKLNKYALNNNLNNVIVRRKNEILKENVNL